MVDGKDVTMSANDLVKELEASDSLVPKKVLQDLSNNTEITVELVAQVEQVFDKYKKQLERDRRLQKNFIEFINYLYNVNLNASQKQRMFSAGFIDKVLSLPEPS